MTIVWLDEAAEQIKHSPRYLRERLVSGGFEYTQVGQVIFLTDAQWAKFLEAHAVRPGTDESGDSDTATGLTKRSRARRHQA